MRERRQKFIGRRREKWKLLSLFQSRDGRKRKEISKLLSKILDFIAHVTFSEGKFVKFSNLAEILRQLIKVE